MRLDGGAAGWSSVLDPAVASQAEEAIAAILHAAVPGLDASLAAGDAGIALMYLYAGRTWERPALLDSAAEALQRALEGASELRISSLFHGAIGVAWALAHMEKVVPGSLEEDPAEELDGALLDELRDGDELRGHDLVSGLVGAGVYALERLPRSTAQECLDLILARLERTRELRSGDTWCWRTPAALLSGEAATRFPNGWCDLGLAHGIAGVIAFLARLCRIEPFRPRAQELLEGALRFLRAQRLPAGAGSVFPAVEEPDPPSSRLAWCYGDLGIAVALTAAARATGQPTWGDEAREIALAAARREPLAAGVKDAGLCHGAAGVGHVFQRLHVATGEPELSAAARAWFARALELRRPGEGVAGFSSLGGPRGAGWQADPSLLGGAAGVALALLAAASPIQPGWGGALLLEEAPA
jgi:class I lanthipeptide synthase